MCSPDRSVADPGIAQQTSADYHLFICQRKKTIPPATTARELTSQNGQRVFPAGKGMATFIPKSAYTSAASDIATDQMVNFLMR